VTWVNTARDENLAVWQQRRCVERTPVDEGASVLEFERSGRARLREQQAALKHSSMETRAAA
jgi:hypothetical protein